MNISKEQIAATSYFLLGLVLSISITIIRYQTGPEFEIAQFYLIPITMVAWFINRDAATILATLSMLFWVVFDLFTLQTLSGGLAPGMNEVFRLITFIVVILLIDNSKQQIRKLTSLSVTDPLTNLYNRRAFFKMLNIELERTKRYDKPISLIYFDLDNFKSINDTLGHNTGDKLLINISKVIVANTRNSDIIGRMGGDEFCILLPETNLASSKLVYDKLNEQVVKMITLNRWDVTVSAGLLDYDSTGMDAESFVNAADELMYAAKNSGKNKLVVRK